MKFNNIDNWLLFGGGDLLLKTAEYLKSNNNKLTVITSERHLNEKLFYIDISFKKYLKKNKIQYFVLNNLEEDFQKQNIILKNTLGLSFGAAWVFKKDFINLFDGKLLNLHGSRLPYDRGGGGYSWQIMRGERIGVSVIHQVKEGIDAGDIIFYESYIFPSECKIPISFIKYADDKYLTFIKKFIEKVSKNENFICKGQPDYLSMYWPRLNTKMQAYINWLWGAKDLERFISAFDDPYEGAITYLNYKVRIKKVFSITTDGTFHPFQNGIIYRVDNSTAVVATSSGSLGISEILDEKGENILDKVKVGDRLFTPIEKIERAIKYRAVYTPKGLKDG